MYFSVGDSLFFGQDISNGIVIDTSCLDISLVKAKLQDSPTIESIKDPLDGYSDTKQTLPYNKEAVLFNGTI